MNFTQFEPHELIVLSKALYFVKFQSQNPSASEIAGSPILGKLYSQVMNALWSKTSDEVHSAYTFIDADWPCITEEQLGTVKFHLSQVENWNDIGKENKVLYIKDLIYPFSSNESIVHSLKIFADLMHMNN